MNSKKEINRKGDAGLEAIGVAVEALGGWDAPIDSHNLSGFHDTQWYVPAAKKESANDATERVKNALAEFAVCVIPETSNKLSSSEGCWVRPKTHVCDECGCPLTAEEFELNTIENADEDGNSLWCDACRKIKRAEAAEVGE